MSAKRARLILERDVKRLAVLVTQNHLQILSSDVVKMLFDFRNSSREGIIEGVDDRGGGDNASQAGNENGGVLHDEYTLSEQCI